MSSPNRIDQKRYAPVVKRMTEPEDPLSADTDCEWDGNEKPTKTIESANCSQMDL
jgi:hypothetical protein